jgi:hypothetical protein
MEFLFLPLMPGLIPPGSQRSRSGGSATMDDGIARDAAPDCGVGGILAWRLL